MSAPTLGWLGIARLGLVQAALGAVVVLTTSTLNRVMVVELALPAMLPGVLVALHYALQVFRPRLGHGSDVGGRRTPWIIGGMASLACGGTVAAVATTVMATHLAAGIALAVLGFTLIGLGVGAAGTSLLVLLAQRTEDSRRGAAATIVWIMMISGFIVTAMTAGKLLDPYSPQRLIEVAAAISLAAFVLALAAVWGMEGPAVATVVAPQPAARPKASFRQALAEVAGEPQTRRFAVFVFLSMIAYSAQDLILEPFAGAVFGFTPGQTTQLSGVQNGGVLAGMLVVAVLSSGARIGSLRTWTIAGCLASAGSLAALALAAQNGPPWPLTAAVAALGFGNGIYAIGAIGSMMSLVDKGRKGREGVRMGVWGAAQAIAFGTGGLLGTIASDLARQALASTATAYSVVFGSEAVLFVVAAVLAVRAARPLAAPAEREVAVATNWQGSAAR